MSRLRGKLTYANVAATLALFLVLSGGAAWAKKNLIDTKDIANGAVTGKKIAKSTIKSKNLKDNKAVTGADVKDGSLADADVGSLSGGKLLNGSVATVKLATEEKAHVLGTPGQPALGNGGENDCPWTDASVTDIPGLNPASFRVDRFGTVHLSGIVESEDQPGSGDEECGATAPEPDDHVEDGIIFTLPAAYRPENAEVRLSSSSGGSGTVIIAGGSPLVVGSDVLPAGAVFSSGPTAVLMDGISFQAASATPFRAPAVADDGAKQLDPKVESLLGL